MAFNLSALTVLNPIMAVCGLARVGLLNILGAGTIWGLKGAIESQTNENYDETFFPLYLSIASLLLLFEVPSQTIWSREDCLKELRDNADHYSPRTAFKYPIHFFYDSSKKIQVCFTHKTEQFPAIETTKNTNDKMLTPV